MLAKHADVKCEKCHINSAEKVKFKPLSTQCVDCRKDPHKGNFGKTCQECHKDGKKLAGLSQQCIACHQKDDVHNGSQPNCKNCHTQHFWEVTSFRHSLSKFPLRGAHRVIECTDCHNNGIYKGLSSSCVSCHLKDFNANPAPHTSGNTNCIDCHKNTFTFSSAN